MSTEGQRSGFEAVPVSATTNVFDTSEVPAETERPPQLGRYVVLQEIGRGGMGVVWTAYDPKLDRKVAIKLLKGSARKRIRRARFIREAQALAKLNHPNIITVHDVGTHGEQLYMAMEYVVGQTLGRWLHQRRGFHEIIDVFEKAGQGLAAAHAADITHRDFKPSNVLIADDGRVKVLDFGLAKHIEHDEPDESGGFEEEVSAPLVAVADAGRESKRGDPRVHGRREAHSGRTAGRHPCVYGSRAVHLGG